MTWHVTGPLLVNAAVQASFSWDDGLDGTPEALAEIAICESLGHVAVTPTGPFIKATRDNELAAFLMCCEVIRKPTVTGEPPEIDAPPLAEGEIG